MTDICDRCGPAVTAKHHWRHPNGKIAFSFCAHHHRNYEIQLRLNGYQPIPPPPPPPA